MANITINYVGLDGEVHRGSLKRARNPAIEDPENGEYYGEEVLQDGNNNIRIISKGAFLDLVENKTGLSSNETSSRPAIKPSSLASEVQGKTAVDALKTSELSIRDEIARRKRNLSLLKEKQAELKRSDNWFITILYFLSCIVLSVFFPIIGIPMLILGLLIGLLTPASSNENKENVKNKGKLHDDTIPWKSLWVPLRPELYKEESNAHRWSILGYWILEDYNDEAVKPMDYERFLEIKKNQRKALNVSRLFDYAYWGKERGKLKKKGKKAYRKEYDKYLKECRLWDNKFKRGDKFKVTSTDRSGVIKISKVKRKYATEWEEHREIWFVKDDNQNFKCELYTPIDLELRGVESPRFSCKVLDLKIEGDSIWVGDAKFSLYLSH